MKKIIYMLTAMVLALSLLFTMVSCGNSKAPTEPADPSGDGAASSDDASSEEALLFDQDSEVELGEASSPVDPASVYTSVTYDHRMFYGSYRILGGDEGEAEYAKSIEQVEYEGGDGMRSTVSAVPYKIEAGPHTFNHILNHIPGKHIMRAYFYNASGNMDTLNCAYTVKGNTLTLNPIATHEYDEENGRIRYAMTDKFFTYTFTFKGRTLTLTDGKNTVNLKTGLAVSSDEPYFCADNYLSKNSPQIDEIDYIRLYWNTDDKVGRLYAEGKEYADAHHGTALLEENGRLTFTLPTESGSKTYSFVYWYCGYDGLILSDGNTLYYYNDGYSDRYGNQLNGNLTAEDFDLIENMDEAKLQEIVEKKADLLTDLSAAFKDAGLAVTINEETGEIAMDAAVLFAVGDYAVSEEGKALLKQFMSVYCSVVFDEKYSDFVSMIMVEGHTDSDGDYDMNLELSQNRADSVKAFCLSPECGVDAYTAQLTDMLKAVGYSYEQPVLDENGEEDKEASRRVCFRFIINLEG